MYRLDQFEREKNCLKYLMPFACIIEPGIVLNKNGSLQTTFRYRGPDLDSAVKTQMGIMTAQLNNNFSLLGSGAALYLEAQRMPSTSYEVGSHFPDPVTAAIDAEFCKQFSNGSHFESNYYLTLYWMPPNDQEGRLREFMIEGRKQKLINGEDHVTYFIDQVEKLFRAFLNLKIPVEWMMPDEIATYLHSTVSTKGGDIVLPSRPVLLDQLLYDDPIAVGLEPGLMLGNKHMRIITPIKYLSMSQFGIFNDLNRLNFPYRWVSRFFCMDKQEAISELDSRRKGWSGKIKSMRTMISEIWTGNPSPDQYNENAMLKVGEVKSAAQLTELDEVGYGYYSTMFVVQDKNLEAVEEKAKTIEQIFLNLGMRVKTEDFNAFDAWLGSIPGNVTRHIRRPLLSTGNFVHMTPLTDIWAGPARNEHWKGPALLYTQTDGNTQFRFDPFVDDVGHTLLVGRTGAGKSVFLNTLVAQCRKYYDAQVVIFDKGGASRVLTEAVGGNFYDLA
uniref:VirB4 family type IV secretion/conjugal transfer ATPase n=1 Tax=Anaerospora hongkongensis TaxID=244830 RepID=UPI002FD947A9